MAKYCTIVVFGATYEQGVYIDSLACEEWEVPGNYYVLMEHATSEEARKAVFDAIEEPYKGAIDRMSRAHQGMHMRARLNSDRLDGPHTFHTDDQLTDTFLIDWAKANVFNQRKEN